MHNINIGTWVPACGGTEQPFITRSGIKVQYLWNNVTGEHRYINCDNDTLIPDNELSLVFGE